tara:strand:+ start:1 stop:1047 length:1047 start_codon:yes stop_codon:yes gene_type:complete
MDCKSKSLNALTNRKKIKSKCDGIVKLINLLLTFNQQELEAKKKLKKQGFGIPFRFSIDQNMIISLSKKVKSILSKESSLLKLKTNDKPIYIFGDIHGQFSDLIRFLELTKLPPKVRLLFLGDYVDRGENNIEVIVLLFALKIKFPRNVYMIRGNHECSQLNQMYGFQEECLARYPETGMKLWETINDTLSYLPIAALVNKEIFCVHGGISQNLKSFDEINKLAKGECIPDSGLMCDLTWSDPKRQSSEYADNDRGVAYTFNEKALQEFNERLGIQLVCRAHQVVDAGYKFFGNNKLVTVFSAPNYCGEVGNNGAVMKVDSNMECSFIVLKPVKKIRKKYKSLSISRQ